LFGLAQGTVPVSENRIHLGVISGATKALLPIGNEDSSQTRQSENGLIEGGHGRLHSPHSFEPQAIRQVESLQSQRLPEAGRPDLPAHLPGGVLPAEGPDLEGIAGQHRTLNCALDQPD
jgi:hypothetical protein